jgi:2-polyprenyl-3-methyl-5-hydroxy-6-metoxy-1,4-benzoquinol methylase
VKPAPESLKRAIEDYAKAKNGKLYAPVLHPDFAHYPASHGESRWNLVEPHLEYPGGTVLDIGSHWGYIPWRLETLGYKVTANENSPTHFPIMKGLRDAGDLSFEVSDKSFLALDNLSYDIVFALNIFHHFIKIESRYKALEKWLGKLNAKMMIFQAHAPDEAQMVRGYKNLDGEEFARWVGERARLPNVQFIGEDHNRKLFKLKRS